MADVRRDLEPAIAEIVNQAERAWPTIHLDPAMFASYLTERLPVGVDPIEAMPNIHADDLYLACACVHGQPLAIAAFKQACLPAIEATLRAMRASPVVVQEITAQLLTDLLVAEVQRPPRIGQYLGRSPLPAWLQVVATRMALRALAREKRHAAVERVMTDSIDGVVSDPELAYLKGLYRDELQAAFQDAARSLSSRERNLLRFQYIDGMTGDEIASLYGVHRATVVRWLTRAREALLDATREQLIARLALDRRASDSIMRLAHSQLDFSIIDLLKSH